MQQRLFCLIILLQCLMIKSQKFSNLYPKLILNFSYFSTKPLEATVVQVTTRPVLKADVNDSYILIVDTINDKTVLIRKINCINFPCSCGECGVNFDSLYLFFQNDIFSKDHVLKIESRIVYIRKLLRDFSYQSSLHRNDMNFTCGFIDQHKENIQQSRDPYDYHFSRLNIFGIVFLSVCIFLVFALCIGWILLIYYRRCVQSRMKKKLRKALAISTQQILDKSPIILFDPDNNDHDDDEPTCAICLEIFQAKQELRKLVCSHYFHMTCIDPWLLSHQKCPLCNRNILRQSIPSISSSVIAAINERNNDESTSIANNDHHEIVQAQNASL